VYKIKYSADVADDLARVRPDHRSRILDRIEVQLKRQPGRQSRNRKILVGLAPPWRQVEPIWELRIGEYRVFYDVDEKTLAVVIRAIRHKPPHKALEEIL
jgi:mRNA-degrading endonuclease RelE of RelBE toxin-antitoxin system